MVKILRESNELKEMPLECIKGATLLHVGAAENLLTQEERKCEGTQKAKSNGLFVYENGNSDYWLRSEGYNNKCNVYCVNSDGGIDCLYYVDHSDIGIRPALILSNLSSSNLKIGDSFELGGYTFKVISNSLALCDVIIDACPFNEIADDNGYETSCVKTIVDEWFQDAKDEAEMHSIGLRSNREIADENDLGF